MSHHFRQPYENFGGNVTIELDLCNYAKKKTGLKGATDIHVRWPQKQIWLA